MTKPTPIVGQKLTAHQLNVAVFIHAYQAQNDNMPTITEVAQAFGIQKNAAHECVQRLKKYGVFEATENFSKYRFTRTQAGESYRVQIKAKRIEQGAVDIYN
jgi:predicted transcriptional regulator of viral defense system